MLKRLIAENWWCIPVPLSALCLVIAWLLGPGAVTAVFAWLAVGLGLAAFSVFVVAARHGSALRHTLRAHHFIVNMAWAGLVVMLLATGKLSTLTAPPEMAYYPGTQGGWAAGDLAKWIREDWVSAGRDLYNVDTDALEERFRKEWHTESRIEVQDTERAVIHLRGEGGKAWRFELTDIDSGRGAWIEPEEWNE
jgi:hypothetical protein